MTTLPAVVVLIGATGVESSSKMVKLPMTICYQDSVLVVVGLVFRRSIYSFKKKKIIILKTAFFVKNVENQTKIEIFILISYF